MNIGTLTIEMAANIARLQADMDQAKQVVSGTMADIKSKVDMVKAAFVGFAGLGIVAGFTSLVKGAIETADSINKLSQRTGIATESLSQLQYAAKLADVSNESLNTGIKKLNQSIVAAAAGEKEKVALFKAIGIESFTMGGKLKTADAVLMEIADSFAKAKDGAGKTAVAVGLLGKAGDEMIPLLNGGSAAIKALMKEADQLGLTIGSEFAANAEEFNDNLTRVQISGQKLAISFAGDVVETLGKAAKAMADATIEGGKLAGVWAGLKTLVMGDAQHQANVKLFNDTEYMLAAENALAKAQASNNTAQIERLKERVRITKEAVAGSQAEFRRLEDESTKAAEAAKKLKDLREGNDIRVASGSGGADKANQELDKQAKLLAELAGLSGSFAEDWDRLTAVYKKGHLTLDAYTSAQADLLAKQPAIKKAADEQKKIEEDRAKIIKTNTDAVEKAVTARDKELEQMVDSNARLRDEIAALGLSDEARTALTATKEREIIASKELDLIQAQNIEGNETVAAQLEREIRLREDRLGLLADKSQREQAVKAYQEDADRLKEMNKQIGQSLTDQLMEGGRSAADYLKNLFRTLVLRPIISGIMNPIGEDGIPLPVLPGDDAQQPDPTAAPTTVPGNVIRVGPP